MTRALLESAGHRVGEVTGWRRDPSIEELLEYDLYYVRHWTLGFDLWIVRMTFFRGFSSKNA